MKVSAAMWHLDGERFDPIGQHVHYTFGGSL